MIVARGRRMHYADFMDMRRAALVLVCLSALSVMATAQARLPGPSAGCDCAAGSSPAASAPATAAPAAATPAAATPLAGWRSLTLSASKPPLYAASATLSVLDATHAGTGRPAVQFSTESQATMLGVVGFNERTTSWIDAEKRGALEFFQLRPGDTARRYVFGNGTIRQTTWEPPAESPEAAFETWKEKETTERRFTFAEGTAPADGEQVIDPYSLIYLLRDLDLAAAQPAPRDFVVLYRRNLVRLRLTAEGQRAGERHVRDESSGAEVTLKLTERRVRIQPQGEAAKSFRGLMGMQGETEIWVDEASRALLEINGQAPGFGATQVLLTSFGK